VLTLIAAQIEAIKLARTVREARPELIGSTARFLLLAKMARAFASYRSTRSSALGWASLHFGDLITICSGLG